MRDVECIVLLCRVCSREVEFDGIGNGGNVFVVTLEPGLVESKIELG